MVEKLSATWKFAVDLLSTPLLSHGASIHLLLLVWECLDLDAFFDIREPCRSGVLMIADYELRLLRGFQLHRDGCDADLPLSSQRVLAFLALQGRPQSRTYVASTLWTDIREERAGASLRSALWRINRCGHGLVAADSQALRLAPDVVVDLHKSARSAHEVLRGDNGDCESRLDDLIAGDLLPGWYEDWVITEREHFRQVRLHALEKLCEQLTLERRFSQAIEAGLAAVAGEPLRESAHRVLIQAYLQEGNRGEAMRQYEACRRVLQRELNIDPSPVTCALLTSPSPPMQ
jgi:DNA-binding SARP family transcriptional activator